MAQLIGGRRHTTSFSSLLRTPTLFGHSLPKVAHYLAPNKPFSIFHHILLPMSINVSFLA